MKKWHDPTDDVQQADFLSPATYGGIDDSAALREPFGGQGLVNCEHLPGAVSLSYPFATSPYTPPLPSTNHTSPEFWDKTFAVEKSSALCHQWLHRGVLALLTFRGHELRRRAAHAARRSSSAGTCVILVGCSVSYLPPIDRPVIGCLPFSEHS